MFANHMRRIRDERGITPTELAFRVGKSAATILRYERGEAQPSLAMARRIAGVLEASVDEVFPDQPAKAPAA